MVPWGFGEPKRHPTVLNTVYPYMMGGLRKASDDSRPPWKTRRARGRGVACVCVCIYDAVTGRYMGDLFVYSSIRGEARAFGLGARATRELRASYA